MGAPTRGVVVTVVLMLILTGLATSLVRQAELRDQQARLDTAALTVQATLEQEFVRLLDLGTATQAALDQVDEPTPELFDELMAELGVPDRYPTLVSAALLELVPRDEVDDVVAARAEQGEFALVDDAGEGYVRLFLYAYPPSVAEDVVGVDLTSRPDSRQAMDRALEAGQPRLSSITQIIQLVEGEPGASIHLPLRSPTSDRPATLGIVVAGQRFLDQLRPLAGEVSVRVLDRDSVVSPVFAQVGDPPEVGAPTSTLDLDVAGRTWHIEVTGGEGYVVPLAQRGSTYLGVAGLLATVLLGLLVWSTSSRERYARDLAATRTRELVRVNEALVDANRHKDQFLASVSHELRTPLTVIAGFAETLERVPPEARHRELVVPIQRNVQRLSRLVEDLLTLASMDAGGLEHHPQRVDLAPLLEAAPAELAGVDPEAVEVQVAPGTVAWADHRHVERMITNLLTNAARHGHPPIELQAHPTEDGRVEVRVRDHGPGVAEPARRELFARFARGSEEIRSSGTGLGLAIVRELAELAGGELRYEPADPGACFLLHLPAPPASDATDGAVDQR